MCKLFILFKQPLRLLIILNPMFLFQHYGLEGIKKLIEAHVCPFCIMRYCNVDNKSL